MVVPNGVGPYGSFSIGAVSKLPTCDYVMISDKTCTAILFCFEPQLRWNLTVKEYIHYRAIHGHASVFDALAVEILAD